MRLTGGHENHLILLQAEALAGDRDFDLSLQDLHQCVERRRMFAQALCFVESKDCHRAGRPFEDLAAYDGALLVIDEFNSFCFFWIFRGILSRAEIEFAKEEEDPDSEVVEGTETACVGLYRLDA